ncbi:MAG: T9SS type A sorting domain-containing protein [Bacteroidia bacterium]|nr:T9SS type A sorting domain-containing protein [Bacteroidia bacterium]
MNRFLVAVVCLIFCFVQKANAVAYTWNGVTSTAWATPTNWTPNGIPGVADNVTISNGALANQPVMGANRTVVNFTISAGTLNLSGFTLTVTGNSSCSGGSVNNGTFGPNTAAGTVTFSGTVFGAQVNSTSANLFFNGGVFNGAVNLFTQTGTTINTSNGGCTFAGITSNTISNTGTGSVILGNVNPDIFNGPVIFNISNVGYIDVATNSLNNQFNQNITVGSSSTGEIRFGYGSNGTSVLAAAKTISASAFTSGFLRLKNFIQTGTTAQNITFTGTNSAVLFSTGTVFNGSLTVSSPRIYLSGGTFNGPVNQFTHTANLAGPTSLGGCTFAGSVSNTISYTGSGLIYMAALVPDIYNGPAIFNNSGTGTIDIGEQSLNNQFNQNVTLSSNNGGAINFCQSTGTCVLAAGKTITASGFTSGTLDLKSFTQTGTTAQNITLTGTSVLIFNSGTVFNGSLTVSSPRIYLSGGTFNGPVNQFTQTGNNTATSTGGCTFAGATSNTISNSGSGQILMANVNPDIFNGPVIFNNSNSGTINVGYNSANNQLNQNVTVSSGGTGTIGFGQGTGTCVLAAGRTISASAFSSGAVNLKNFTQTGATVQNITLTGTSNLVFNSGTVFNGSVTASAPNLFLNGSTFNGATNSFTKTGTVLNSSTGGCTFAGATSNTITNNGTGELRMGITNADIFNGPVIFNNNSSSGGISVAYSSANNQFNQNLIVNSTAAGAISFGSSTGTSVLANTKTISATTFTDGSLFLRNFTQTGATAQSITFTGTTATLSFGNGVVFNGSVTASVPNLYFGASVFNGAVNQFAKTSATGNFSGGATFAGATSNTFINAGTGELRFGSTAADIFNGPAIFNSTNSGIINVAHTVAGNQFNQNVTVSSNSSGSVRFGQGGGAGNLASGKTIAATTFTSGDLYFQNFTQTGTTAQSIVLTGTSGLYYQSGTVFNGSLSTSSPNLFLNGGTYNGAVNQFTQTGSALNSSIGGCTFAGATSNTISNSGTGEIRMATVNADVFNGAAVFNNSNTGIINTGYDAANNQFNQNITLISSSSGSIMFGQGNGTSVLASGRFITATSFASGTLNFKNFTQLGTTFQNITLGGASNLYFSSGTVFNGLLTGSASNLFLNGSTFNGSTTLLVQTGSQINSSTGGCTFAASGSNTISNTGTGEIRMATVNPDVFNAATVFNTSNSGTINVGYNGINNQFNQNIILTSTNSGTIGFGQGTGTCFLASGKTISGSTFSSGNLRLKNFTQQGATPSNTLTLTGTSSVYFETGTAFNTALFCTSPNIYLEGATFNLSARFTKSGGVNNSSSGGNTFTSCQFINNASADFQLGASSPDTYYTNATFTNNGFGYLDVAYSSSGNQFISCNIKPNSSTYYGVYFGFGGGTSSIVNGDILPAYSGVFNDGSLAFYNFTHLGSASGQNISLTGNAKFESYNSIYNVQMNVSSPSINLSNSIFNSGGSFAKTGAADVFSFGGNVFSGVTYFDNQAATGVFYESSNSGDVYNDDVYYVGSGTIYAAYNGTSQYMKDIYIFSTPPQFGLGNGIVEIAGISGQNINADYTNPTIMKRLKLNSSATCTVNGIVNVTDELYFTSGYLNTSSVFYPLTLTETASVITPASNNSHITGSIKKIGNTAFTFPVGDGTQYMPISISAPTTITDAFTAKYNHSNSDVFYDQLSKDATIDNISACDYWNLERETGSSDVAVTIGWDNSYNAACPVTDPNDLLVAHWNSTLLKWEDYGKGGTTGNAAAGTITSASALNNFSPIALGSKSFINQLPISMLSFTAEAQKDFVELKWITASEHNNDYYTVERSIDGINFETILTEDSKAPNGNSFQQLSYTVNDNTPLDGVSYYRLKQTDFGGQFSYSALVNVNYSGSVSVSVFPNPVSDEINLSQPETENIIFQLYNSAGELVSEWNGNEKNKKIPVQHLAAGIYYYKIIEGQNFRSGKLIKK